MRSIILYLLFLLSLPGYSQTLGGSSVFNFLKLPHTPQLTGLGNINVSHPSNDIGLAFNNPALLTNSMHSQMQAVFHKFYAGINQFHLSMGYHHEKSATNFGGGVTYIDYGTIPATDAAGNILGNFKPADWVVQVMVSRSYLEKWNYGGSLKFIQSDYGQYNSSGLAADIGVVYNDSSEQISASVLVKNLGYQLSAYPGTEKDELPFDLQAGISKKLANAPLSFSLTAHHIHRFDILYHDTITFNSNINPSRGNFFNKLFLHLVLGTTVYIGDKIEINSGYNFLRRKELKTGQADGLTGFSFGLGLLLDKLHIRYARSWYQNTTGGNQLGITMTLNKYFGLGRLGEKIGW